MTAVDRVANVLGALALAVTDRTSAAIAAAAGQSVSAAAALSAMHHFLDRPTLDQLRRVLGLTHSGAVRLVDRLVDAGLVTRGPGP
ncbi:MAG UNVERIFIED_CONTAM: MarR family transcriptional regulator, partial [Thermobifida fusca]